MKLKSNKGGVLTKNNLKKRIVLAAVAVLALNSTAVGIWSANKGNITSSADTVVGEKYIPVLVNDSHLKTSSGVKTQSNSIAMAKQANIDLDNPIFSEPIVVDDGKGWDLNLVAGGSLLPLNANSSHSINSQSDSSRLIFDTGNSQTIPTLDDHDSTSPNGSLEFGSLNQKFSDTEDSDQYGFKLKLKVNSGKAIIGLSSDTSTAYSYILDASESVQTANVTWRDLTQKPNRVFVGVVGKSFDINLYSAELYRPVISNFATIPIGGKNIDHFTKIIPHEKYFYYPNNQSFETKLSSVSDKIAYWKTATTNYDVPPPLPEPGGTTTSTSAVVTTVTSAGPPPPPPPPGGTTTTTTSVSGQGNEGPPAPPPPPSASLIKNAKAQASIFTDNSINQPKIVINETPDANSIIQGATSGIRSLYFNGTNINSTTNSSLVDFIYQTLGDNFTNNYIDFPDFSFELNADIKVVRGKVVAGVANSSDLKGKIKVSSVIGPSETIQHLVLPVTTRDVEKNKFDMIVIGGVQGLVEFYLDNVYLTVTDQSYTNNSSYAKYRFSGSSDNLNWDLAKWGNFEKPVGENHIVAIDPVTDIANGSQFIRVQTALYSEDPYYVPGVESFDLFFTELTSPTQTTSTTTAIGGTTAVSTTTTEPTITPTNPKTPESNNSFSKLVATGGVLWVNLIISMTLSAIVTWLIFRKKKLSPTQ